MDAVERHALEPDASFDGGDLDCGNGLLLLIRQHIDPLRARPASRVSLHGDLGGGGLPGLVPHDRERVGLARPARARAKLSRLQGPARRAGRARGGAAPPRRVRARRDRRQHSRRPARARPGARGSAALRHGRRKLAATALDAGGHPRAHGGAALRRGVRRHVRGRDAPRRGGPAPGGRRRGDRRRAAARQLRELRGRPPRQLPAHPTHRPAAPGRRSRGVRGRAEIARRARLRGAPSRRVRAPRPEPAPGGSRARLRALAHRPAGEGRPARPVSPHAHHVDGVHHRPRVPLSRGPGPGHRARAARGDSLPARSRREPRPARRARALRGRLHRRRRAVGASCAAP